LISLAERLAERFDFLAERLAERFLDFLAERFRF
jgi:hypothetical protein